MKTLDPERTLVAFVDGVAMPVVGLQGTKPLIVHDDRIIDATTLTKFERVASVAQLEQEASAEVERKREAARAAKQAAREQLQRQRKAEAAAQAVEVRSVLSPEDEGRKRAKLEADRLSEELAQDSEVIELLATGAADRASRIEKRLGWRRPLGRVVLERLEGTGRIVQTGRDNGELIYGVPTNA